MLKFKILGFYLMDELTYQDAVSYLDAGLQNANIDLDTVFNEVKSKYSTDGLVFCIKHILSNYNDTKILDKTVRYTVLNFNKQNLPSIVDFILRQNNNDAFTNIKVLAIKSLPKYKDTSVVQSLLFCLKDKNSSYKIKLSAVDALGKIGDRNAFDMLGKIATDEKENSAYVKETAVTALGMLGDDRAIEVFSSIMETKQIFKEKFSFLKEKIMEAMDKFDISRNKKALEIIKKSLYDPNGNVRIAAVETLMNSGINESYDLIYDVLKYDSDMEVRKNALVALFNITCDIKVLEDVIRGDYSEDLKNHAIKTIKEIEANKNE